MATQVSSLTSFMNHPSPGKEDYIELSSNTHSMLHCFYQILFHSPIYPSNLTTFRPQCRLVVLASDPEYQTHTAVGSIYYEYDDTESHQRHQGCPAPRFAGQTNSSSLGHHKGWNLPCDCSFWRVKRRLRSSRVERWRQIKIWRQQRSSSRQQCGKPHCPSTDRKKIRDCNGPETDRQVYD